MNQSPTVPAPAVQTCQLHAAIAMHLIRDQWRRHVRITLYSLAGLANSAPRAVELMQHDLQEEIGDITGRQS